MKEDQLPTGIIRFKEEFDNKEDLEEAGRAVKEGSDATVDITSVDFHEMTKSGNVRLTGEREEIEKIGDYVQRTRQGIVELRMDM
ncbi:hypothetical protein KJ652_00050 [Patescibacteria group bacterium]|nr:hypothetical protein [Patescibacteria group bacterium]